jgi:hypothetical protein
MWNPTHRCYAKSVAWTNHMISPGIYNMSNGFTVIWLFGQFRWSSCNKLALFSYLSDNHLFGALLWAAASFLHGEGGDVKYTLMGGLLAGHGRPARPLSQRKHTQQQQGGVPVQQMAICYGSCLQFMLKLVPWFVVTCWDLVLWRH